jgi:subtilisin family serine protease
MINLARIVMLFAFLPLFSYCIEPNYYWYQGQKVLFEQKGNKKYITLNLISDSGKLKELFPHFSILEFGKCDLSNGLHHEYKKQVFVEYFAIVQSDSFGNLDSNNYIKYHTPYFEINNAEAGLSHLFYVKLKDNNDINILKNKCFENKVEIVGQNQFMPEWYTIQVTKWSKGNALQMANLFYESNLFATAEPDFLVDDQLHCVDDPLFVEQWNLSNTGLNRWIAGVDIKACQAWGITSGNPNVIVAVLDEGVELNHPEIANYTSISYDSESKTSPSIVHGSHATAAAGVIGASKNNNKGIAGIAPDCKVMSVSNKLKGNPDSRKARADGLNWAWQNGASVINNSWSSSIKYQIIDDAIGFALSKGRNGLGTVVVFSTGNEDNNKISYPSNANAGIIAVGAASPCGQRKSRTPVSCDGAMWGSNYGEGLDVVAPGVLIPTTDRVGEPGYSNSDFINNWFGTSAAAPQVSGAVALMLSLNPNLSAKEIERILHKTAQKIGNYSYSTDANKPNGSWNEEVGYGLLDINEALRQSYCNITEINNQTITTDSIYSNCVIKTSSTNVESPNTLFNCSKEVEVIDNFIIKDGSLFEIKTD